MEKLGLETGSEVAAELDDDGLGRFFDDFHVGQICRHWPGRTISETDNTWFTLLTMNTHPLHFDQDYAKKSEFGRLVVSSGLTLAIVLGMSVRDISQRAIANLGWKEIRLTAPVFVGDTIYARSEVIAIQRSRSRPRQGILTVATTGTKSNNEIFMTFSRSVLLPCRDAVIAP